MPKTPTPPDQTPQPEILRTALGYFGSKKVSKITQEHHPELYNLIQQANPNLHAGYAIPPDIYLVGDAELPSNHSLPQAFYMPSQDSFYMNEAMLRSFSTKELRGYLAHELIHPGQPKDGDPDWKECDADRRAAEWVGEDVIAWLATDYPIQKQMAEKILKDATEDKEQIEERCSRHPLNYLLDTCNAVEFIKTGRFLNDPHESHAERIARIQHDLPCPGEEGYGPVPPEMLEEARQLSEAPEATQSGLPRNAPTPASGRQKR